METPAPVDLSAVLPFLVAGTPIADVDRAARTLAARADTPEGALEVMKALLVWFGRADAAAACDSEETDARRGEALSLLAWALADQQHDAVAERVGETAVALGLRRAATDALMLVLERSGRTAERDALVGRYLASDDDEGYHALVPVQTAALEAWTQGDLVRSTNLSRALVERSPADVEALFRAGYGLYSAGQWAPALELLQRYRRWTEDDDHAVLPVAGCLYGLGRYDEAMGVLGKILEGGQSQETVFLAWVQIAWNELGKGLLDRAEGALVKARGVLEALGAVDEELLGPARSDLDSIEGVIDALSGQLDLAHRTLGRMRRTGARGAPILEEAIADIESGRVQAFGRELPRHRRGRPRGSLAERLRSAKAGEVIDLDSGTWEAGGVELPAGVTVRGQGPDTVLTGARGPVLVSRSSGGALERVSVVLAGAAGDDQVALLIDGGDVRVTDCVVEAKRGTAVSIRGDARPTLQGVDFRGGMGLGVHDTAAPIVRGGHVAGGAKRFGVMIVGQAAGEWHGVEIASTDWACVRVIGSAAPAFTGCKVHGSKSGSGFWIGEDAQGVYTGNEVFENRHPGFLSDERSKPVLRANRVHHHACTGIQLAGKSSATVEGNEVSDIEAALVECLHESTPTVRGNQLLGGAGPGVWVLHSSAPLVEDNRVTATRRAGVEVAYSARPTMRRNHIQGSQASGLRITENAGGTFEDTTIQACLSGIDIGGNATPTLRGARVERSEFAGLVTQAGAIVTIEGLTITGGKVGLDLAGRSLVNASGVTVDGVQACPVQVGGAAVAVLVGAKLGPPLTEGPTLLVTGGADVTLRDATVDAGASAPAVTVRGQGAVRIDGGTVTANGRPPIVASELGRVRVRVAALRGAGAGSPAIDASGDASVALEDAHADGDVVHCRERATREAWEEPLVPDAHAYVVLLVRGPVDEAVVSASLGAEGGAEGFVRASVGRTPLSRAVLAPIVAADEALATLAREAQAWVVVHRKPGVSVGGEVEVMRQFAHAVLRAVRATSALAIWSPRGALLVPASQWTEARIDGPELARLFCTVRSVLVGNNVVVETVGLAAFGQQDVQCESAASHRTTLEPIFTSFVDAIVTDTQRYGYRAVTRPVGTSPQTFMVQEGKHDFPPARRVWSLQPIGDLGAGGGWAKQAKPAWGKKANAD